MDDVGASTKRYEVYGRETFEIFGKKIPMSKISNFLFLKYIPPFKKWAPYRELKVPEWQEIFQLLKNYNAKLTVGITASWVERDMKKVPFPVKFPDEASIIREGVQEGIVELANHGLTHCVPGKHLPLPFSSNRSYHREFWDWLPKEIHWDNIERSQEILSKYFNISVVTFIPPGNVWTDETEKAAAACGIKYFSSRGDKCQTNVRRNNITFLSDNDAFAFHDREIVVYGIEWLKNMLVQYSKYKITTVKGFFKE